MEFVLMRSWAFSGGVTVPLEGNCRVFAFGVLALQTPMWLTSQLSRGYEFHLWKSFLYEMAIGRGPSRYQRRQTPGHCIRGPGIAWLRFGNRDHLPQVQVEDIPSATLSHSPHALTLTLGYSHSYSADPG